MINYGGEYNPYHPIAQAWNQQRMQPQGGGMMNGIHPMYGSPMWGGIQHPMNNALGGGVIPPMGGWSGAPMRPPMNNALGGGAMPAGGGWAGNPMQPPQMQNQGYPTAPVQQPQGQPPAMGGQPQPTQSFQASPAMLRPMSGVPLSMMGRAY